MKKSLLSLGFCALMGIASPSLYAVSQEHRIGRIPYCCNEDEQICTRINGQVFYGPSMPATCN